MKYRLFGKNTGLYASELILGGALFGTTKGYGASKEEAQTILTNILKRAEILLIPPMLIKTENPKA